MASGIVSMSLGQKQTAGSRQQEQEKYELEAWIEMFIATSTL
jgi:hypothetical protein